MNSIRTVITGTSLEGKEAYFEAYIMAVPRVGETVELDWFEYVVEKVTWHFDDNRANWVSIKAKEV